MRWHASSPAARRHLIGLVVLAALTATGLALALGGRLDNAAAGTAARAATTTLTPIADAYVDSGARTTRYGTATRLAADASPTRISYLRFDLTGVAGTLTEARLRLHVADATDAPSPSGGTDRPASPRRAGPRRRSPTPTGRPASARPSRRSARSRATPGSRCRSRRPSRPGAPSRLAIRSTNTDGVLYDSREAGANAPQLVVTTSDTPPPRRPHRTTAAAAACSGQLVRRTPARSPAPP